MTSKELETSLKLALVEMLEGTGGKVTALAEILSESPVKALCGVRVTGIAPDDLLAIVKSPTAFDALRASLINQWPEGFVFRLPPKSIAIAADEKTVIFDLHIYTELTKPMSLTRKAA
jgi:hypothetical protein